MDRMHYKSAQKALSMCTESIKSLRLFGYN